MVSRLQQARSNDVNPMKRGSPETALRAAALLFAAVFFLTACEPFVARVKGGSESRPDWEIGVRF